jgi:hypothetical protein
MTSGRNNTAEEKAAVVIRHRSAWDPGRHAPAFIRPLAEGVLRRLALADKRHPFSTQGGAH